MTSSLDFKYSRYFFLPSKNGTAAITSGFFKTGQWTVIKFKRSRLTIESDPYSLGRNLFTPAEIAASMTMPWSARAVMGSILIRACCPLRISVRDSIEKSLLTTFVPSGNLRVEVSRAMAVTLKVDLTNTGRTNAPRLPLPYTNVGVSSCKQRSGRRGMLNVPQQ